MGSLVQFDVNHKSRKLNDLRARRIEILKERTRLLLLLRDMRLELEENESDTIFMIQPKAKQ